MLRVFRHTIILISLLTVGFLFSDSIKMIRSASAIEMQTVTFAPQWLPQAQFAGFYVAYEKGFYKKHGIDLIVMRKESVNSPPELLYRRKVNFTTMFLATAIPAREKGVKLVNIGQIVQKSGYMLVAKKSQGIVSLGDLNGKKIALWPTSRVQADEFFHKFGIKAHVVPQGSSMNLFLRGGVDAASAMWYNEYHTLLNAGLEEKDITAFFFDQYGLNFPEDGIYCLEEFYMHNRLLCCNFAKASLEGWQYAFDHPKEAINIVMKYVWEANMATNRTHQEWMLKRMKDLILTGNKTKITGHLDEADYKQVAMELQKYRLIKRIPKYGDFYVDCTTD